MSLPRSRSLCILSCSVTCFSAGEAEVGSRAPRRSGPERSGPEHSRRAPLVVVQLPVYNEPAVIHRLLDACVQLKHPPESLVIQVLDDSTDATTELIREWLASSAVGPPVHHIRRLTRDGFKAGALQHGLELLLDTDFALILDADFVPAPDVLLQTVPQLLADPTAAGVQTVWGHLNRHDSWLTRAQATMLDNHLVIEQGGRSALGGFTAFNGSGGLLRVGAIRRTMRISSLSD